MAVGETVYIRLDNEGSEKVSVKVTATTVEAMTLTMDAAAQISFTAEDIEKGITRKWLAFTSTKSGYYQFTKEAVTGYIYAYYGEDGYSLDSEKFVAANKTVYISVEADAEASANVTVATGETEFNYEVIALNQVKHAEIKQGEYVLYEFTAPKAGDYAFYSTTDYYYDTYGQLYNENMNIITSDDESGEYGNFLIERSLKKGQTVYLKVKEYYSGAMICDVHVELAN